MGRPFFPLFFKDKKKLEYLSMEQRGELLTALFTYAEDGTLPTLDGISGFAFEVFREGIDMSLDAYEEVCRKNRENGKKGGRPKKNRTVSEKTEKNPTKPNETQKTEIEAEVEVEVEDEDEAEAEAEAEGGVLAAAVRSEFNDLFGRSPSDSFVLSARGTGLDANTIALALRECKEKKAANPEAYATAVLRRWVRDGVPQKYAQQASGRQPEPDAPLSDWERDWLDEYRAMQGKTEAENEDSC